MRKTRREIVRDLLRDAGYYWYDDHESSVEAIDLDQFDPVIDKIFKASAVELEKLYAELDESQREITLALAQVLAPDQAMLPQPGYTVAQLVPKSRRLHTVPEDQYTIQGQSDTGEQHEYYFSPLFEHEFPKCNLVAILTEHSAFVYEDNVPRISKQLRVGQLSQEIWLGLQLPQIKENDSVSFFLGNQVVDDFDTYHRIFHRSTWYSGADFKIQLTTKSGIRNFSRAASDKEDLLKTLNFSDSYQDRVLTRFHKDFLHLILPKSEEYLATSPSSEPTLLEDMEVPDDTYWFKVKFDLPIPDQFFLDRVLFPNCIPLVNRRLQETSLVRSDYDRVVLPLPTNDLFLDVLKMEDSSSAETYQRINFLNENTTAGTYLLRGANRVRRLNRNDASSQIQRLLEVINEEYRTFKEEGVSRLKEDFGHIEKSINRIRGQLPNLFREENQKNSFYCIATLRRGVSRLICHYWETQGDLIRHLGDRMGLEVSTYSVNIEKGQSIIAIQKGQGELKPNDYINQLKFSLLSRGRITTKGDIKMYCQLRYGEMLEVEKISRELMMIDDDFRRGILVSARSKKALSTDEVEFIRVELQNELNARSSFFTLIQTEILQ